jgi:hypothetical protein
MMEFKLTIDITDRLADAIAALSASVAESTTGLAAALEAWQLVEERASRKAPAQCAQDVAGRAEDVPPAVTRPEPEKSRTEAQERVTEPADDARIADCAGEQFHCPTPAHPIPAVGTGDSGATPDPAAPDKPKKKKAPKKPVEAPERVPDAAPAVTQPEPEKSRTETQERATEPVPGTPEPEPAASAPDDPMRGMTVIDAVKALVDEIQEKGIDMAQVNARVRAKANEIGLAYASAACLIKAIGYAEARRVALGEK